jgi:hypothetical protein
MTQEKEILVMLDDLLTHPYFISIQNRLDAGVQRKTLNVSAWEHLILAQSQMKFHIAKRDSEFPEIKYLDDNDPSNDDIKKIKSETISDIATKKPLT